MRWWPIAATVSGAAFALSAAVFLAAPSMGAACAAAGTPDACGSFLFGTRSLLVGSGAFFAASLVAGAYAALLTLATRRRDTGPLVSVHERRRP